MTRQFLSAISVLVADYDEALEFYVGQLGFDLIEDTALRLCGQIGDAFRREMRRPRRGKAGAGDVEHRRAGFALVWALQARPIRVDQTTAV